LHIFVLGARLAAAERRRARKRARRGLDMNE